MAPKQEGGHVKSYPYAERGGTKGFGVVYTW